VSAQRSEPPVANDLKPAHRCGIVRGGVERLITAVCQDGTRCAKNVRDSGMPANSTWLLMLADPVLLRGADRLPIRRLGLTRRAQERAERRTAP